MSLTDSADSLTLPRRFHHVPRWACPATQSRGGPIHSEAGRSVPGRARPSRSGPKASHSVKSLRSTPTWGLSPESCGCRWTGLPRSRTPFSAQVRLLWLAISDAGTRNSCFREKRDVRPSLNLPRRDHRVTRRSRDSIPRRAYPSRCGTTMFRGGLVPQLGPEAGLSVPGRPARLQPDPRTGWSGVRNFVKSLRSTPTWGLSSESSGCRSKGWPRSQVYYVDKHGRFTPRGERGPDVGLQQPANTPKGELGPMNTR